MKVEWLQYPKNLPKKNTLYWVTYIIYVKYKNVLVVDRAWYNHQHKDFIQPENSLGIVAFANYEQPEPYDEVK
jgi:hypothetical protein